MYLYNTLLCIVSTEGTFTSTLSDNWWYRRCCWDVRRVVFFGERTKWKGSNRKRFARDSKVSVRFHECHSIGSIVPSRGGCKDGFSHYHFITASFCTARPYPVQVVACCCAVCIGWGNGILKDSNPIVSFIVRWAIHKVYKNVVTLIVAVGISHN